MRFSIQTLGCKVNQYESEQIRQVLIRWGWESVAEHEQGVSSNVDVWIVNSCAVTAEAEAKSRRVVRQGIKRLHPKRCIVFGCSVENFAPPYASILGVTDVVTAQATGGNRVAAVLRTLEVPEEIFRPVLERGLRQFGSRHRAYLKVQDGCKQFCTYCRIPYLRSELSSVPPAEVLTEAQGLVNCGYKELVLTGIHLGFYGQNPRSRTTCVWETVPQDRSAKISLASLVEQLIENLSSETPFRLRISSLEAHEADDALLEVMAAHRAQVCPHLHLSMQSGSESVLQRMHRPGTLEQYETRCQRALEQLDSPALTTDCIVGFPGETEQEFLETCDTVRRIGFSKIHIFPFSARRGTPAAQMSDPVPNEEKQRRAAYLAEIERELHSAFVQKMTNHPQQFLLETFDPQTKTVSGTSEYYLHGTFPGTEQDVGQFRTS